MPTVNFYLKKADSEGDKCLIYLQFKYGGQKLVYSFGQKVYKANWNAGKQRVKSNKETTADGQHSLNDLLENLDRVLTKAYNDEIKSGLPSKRKLKEHLDNFIYQNLQEDTSKENTLFKLIDRFIAGEIKYKGRDKSQSSLDNYGAVKKHLIE